MAGEKVAKNMFFTNAPAGSGKTHFIKDKINSIIDKSPHARILCITYTERAAKELQVRITSKEVFISTIHSFVNYFISPYYAHPEAINLYYVLYKDEAEKRIQENNILEIDDPQNRNTIYLKAKGLESSIDLTINLIKENTKSIYYNAHNFNTLYYGGLSHDNLLEFAFTLLEKYPVLQLRLREMFKYIFVDEVQDTDAKILHLFYDAVKETSTELFYFGDKMQEIYENYDGSFENEYKVFDSSLSKEFKYNYRSHEEIVNLLNGLYGRKNFEKQISKSGPNGILPKLIICSNIEEYYYSHTSELEGFLNLRIANRARFMRSDQNESMETIFNQISNIYPQGSKITPVEVMLPNAEENSPDILVDFFFTFGKLKSSFEINHYADVIRLLNSKTFTHLDGRKRNIFHSIMKVLEHDDKARIQEILKKALKEYSCDSKYSLRSFLEYLIKQNVVNYDFLESINQFEDDEGKALYSQLLDVNLSEMKRLISYKENQTISTQHGVKGEGHSKVCFWSEDSRSTRPYVYMYDFFKMYTQLDEFSLETFQNFYYKYKLKIITLEKSLGIKISKLKSADITQENIDLFDQMLNTFDNDMYFKYIFNDSIQSYEEKRLKNKRPTLKDIQATFKPDVVNRILVAYKLFYVGCSRAKEELVVLVEKSKICAFEECFKSKMASIGFHVE
jgi:DNA helicase-2/ATP-dependent DNA helicase PcrA